ncbi:MAG: FkbM family methyltransferase [Deltaproteobacteria bacterium]
MRFSSAHVAPLGQLWVPRHSQRHAQVKKLVSEVEEYFGLGLEVRPGDVVFDIGANIGVFAMTAARRGRGTSVYAFEPIPSVFEALERNLESLRAEGHVARSFQVGLAANDDLAGSDFYHFRNFPSDSTRYIDEKRREFSRFFAAQGQRFRESTPWIPVPIASRLERFIGTLPEGPVGRWVSDRVTGLETVRCSLTTLSSVIESEGVARIDAMKIDVEGAEMDVIAGIRDEHWSLIRSLVIEGHDEDGALERLRGTLRRVGLTEHTLATPECGKHGLNNYLLYAARPRNP